jgi:glycosidase
MSSINFKRSNGLVALIVLLTFSVTVFAETPSIKVEPPFWWAGMNDNTLQLLVYASGINSTQVSVNYPGVKVAKIQKAENPSYLFVDLVLDKKVKPGAFDISFKEEGKIKYTYSYELKKRNGGSAHRKGFNPSDVVYLLMPDRFANADPSNDNIEGMLEKADRLNPSGRHGGDIRGIINHLDYIKDLGITAVWINPLLENNNKAYSYHGYAITDFYKIDPRFGSNDDYIKLVSAAHQQGLKIIMDMIFNHCGINHWFINDLPMKSWIHEFPKFTRSNFKAESLSDPHASEYDRNLMTNGWFDTNMPDLDQTNPFVSNYLIQNSIWWIEYSGIDGIRMDTQPYPNKEFMSEWGRRIFKEYPDFNIVGEAWLPHESMTAYYQKDSKVSNGYNSNIPSVTDFPLYNAIGKSFNIAEGMNQGVKSIYYVLAQDFLYANPAYNLIFADNHDLNRVFSTLKGDFDAYKLAMTFLLTTRGIPEILYGTEILMRSDNYKSDGEIRKDFPGGWNGDSLNLFTAEGRNASQKEAFNFMQTLLKWRSTNEAVTTGTLKHYIPENDVYVYFRIKDNHKVMVLLNNNANAQPVETSRFSEDLNGVIQGRNVLSDKPFTFRNTILLEPRQALIIEFDVPSN